MWVPHAFFHAGPFPAASSAWNGLIPWLSKFLCFLGISAWVTSSGKPSWISPTLYYQLSHVAHIYWGDTLISVSPPLYLMLVKVGTMSDFGFLLCPEPSQEPGSQSVLHYHYCSDDHDDVCTVFPASESWPQGGRAGVKVHGNECGSVSPSRTFWSKSPCPIPWKPEGITLKNSYSGAPAPGLPLPAASPPLLGPMGATGAQEASGVGELWFGVPASRRKQ